MWHRMECRHILNGGVKMNEKEAIKILKEKGYKYTLQRKAIIDVLSKDEGPYKANEIFALVGEKLSGINFSTIYRNLELLIKLGIVNKLAIEEGLNHYELKTGEHHHHIICKQCGKVKEIDLCPFREMEKDKLDELGFEPLEHRFEIYGLCKGCKNKDLR